MSFGRISGSIAGVALAAFAQHASAQLRIVTYNTQYAAPHTGLDAVLEGIGIESKNGIARPIDILMIQEADRPALNIAQAVTDILNGIYGAGAYARSTVPGTSTDGLTQAAIYRTDSVSLIGQVGVGASSTTGAPRQPVRFQFRLAGYGPADSASDLFIYNSHYHSTDAARRDIEAVTIRQNADALGASANIIYLGDFNMDDSAENSGNNPYQRMLATGNGQAADPVGAPGRWTNNSTFAALHTQSPQLTQQFSGAATGGMDDRFDMQLPTTELMDGEGWSYIGLGVPSVAVAPAQHSYHAFGNNGTVFNKAINDPSSTALPLSEYSPGAGQPTRSAVLNALHMASDHIPMVADYQIPARMGVSAASAPARLIVGAPASVSVSVSNTASVVAAIGADELDYTLAGAGDASGAAAGTDLPLGGGNLHALPLATALAGARLAQITVQATSPNLPAAEVTQVRTAAYSVLDHASASLSASDNITMLNLDFGVLPVGAGLATLPFALHNRMATAGYTAALDLDAVAASGDVGVLRTDAAPLPNLPAGSSRPMLASFDTSVEGIYSATWLLKCSDEDLPGATAPASQVLTVTVTGRAAYPEWLVDADGQWGDTANWLAAVPDGAGATARLIKPTTATRTITLTQPRTVGRLVLSNPDGYVVAGSELRLASTPEARIDVQAGDHEVQSGLALVSATRVSIQAGAVFTLSGPLDNAAGRTLAKDGPGLMVISGPQAHGPGASITVAEGTLQVDSTAAGAPSVHIASGSGAATLHMDASQALATLHVGPAGIATLADSAVLRIAQLAIDGGTLDIGGSATIVDCPASSHAAVLADLLADLTNAHNSPGAPWAGPGITSTRARDDNAMGLATAVGILLNDDGTGQALWETFAGHAVNADAILMRYTLAGDANLDGAVTIHDVMHVQIHIGHAGYWADGDFDYSGVVDLADLELLLGNMGHSVAAPDWGIITVPEPALAGSLVLAGMLLRRRRREQSHVAARTTRQGSSGPRA